MSIEGKGVDFESLLKPTEADTEIDGLRKQVENTEKILDADDSLKEREDGKLSESAKGKLIEAMKAGKKELAEMEVKEAGK